MAAVVAGGETEGMIAGGSKFIARQVAHSAMVPFMHPLSKHSPTASIAPSMTPFRDSSTNMMYSVSSSPSGSGATLGATLGASVGVPSPLERPLLPLPLPLRLSASCWSAIPNRQNQNSLLNVFILVETMQILVWSNFHEV